MDLEEGLDLADAAGIDNVGMDFRELVDSIYNDRRIFPGQSTCAVQQVVCCIRFSAVLTLFIVHAVMTLNIVIVDSR
jgi:hypothetical protein